MSQSASDGDGQADRRSKHGDKRKAKKKDHEKAKSKKDSKLKRWESGERQRLAGSALRGRSSGVSVFIT